MLQEISFKWVQSERMMNKKAQLQNSKEILLKKSFILLGFNDNIIVILFLSEVGIEEKRGQNHSWRDIDRVVVRTRRLWSQESYL